MASTELGAAYVTVMPSMKDFQSQVDSGVKSAFGGVKGILSGALAAGAAAAGAKFSSAAMQAYADFEQLQGGIETMFKGSASTVAAYAAGAYKTAGLSANSYMEQVTSFSASLLQGLGGDTAKAADYADQAVKDMADNVNKFGSNIQSVQDAYQGFSKQNFEMLDNLKLGYGGTKAEMERLIADANKVKAAHGEMADLSIDSFADITEAIHVVQTEMGITGTTAQEAATTISGSVASMRASWQNWLAGLADDGADVGALTDQLVDSAVIAAGNIIPRMGQIASSLGETLMAKGPEIAFKLGGALLDALPQTLSQTFRSSVQLWDMGGTLEEKIRLTFGYLKAVVSQEFSGMLSALGPEVEGFVSKLGGAAGAVAAFKGVSSIGGIAAGIAPQLMSAGKSAGFFVKSFAGIARTQGVGTALSMLARNLTATGGALSFLASPVTLVVGAIAALAAAFAYFYTTNEGFRSTIDGIGATMMTSMGPALASIGQTLGDLAATVMPQIQAALSAVAPVIMQILTVVAQLGATLAPIIAQVVATVLPILAQIIAAVVQVASAIMVAVMPVLQQIVAAIQTAMPFIQAVVTTVMGAVLGVIQTVWPTIKGIIDGALAVIQTVITAVMQAISGDWEGAWNTISTFLSGAWEGIKGAVSDGIQGVCDFFSGLGDKVLNAIGDLGSLLWDAGSSIIDGLWNGLKDAWSNVTGWFGEITSAIPNLKGPRSVDAKLLVGNGRVIMDGLLGGMKDGWTGVEGYLSERTAAISSAFGGAMADISDPGSWGSVKPLAGTFAAAEPTLQPDPSSDAAAERVLDLLAAILDKIPEGMSAREFRRAVSACV